MKTRSRVLSFFLAVIMMVAALPLAALPPLEVSAARASCSSSNCDGCDVTCTFNPKSELAWGDDLSFSGKITSDTKIQKVTVKAFDIDNPDKYAFQTFTNQAVNSKTFYLSNVDDFTAGQGDSKNWEGTTITIYVVLQGETGVHHQFEYDIEFVEDFDVSEDYLDFSALGGTDTFKITASSAYTIQESLSWISLSSTSGSSDKTITVTCSKNTSTASRSGIITVKHTATGDTYEIEVEQDGAEITYDCTFEPEDSYFFDEDIEFSGKITSNATIEKVTIGFYDTDNPGTTGTHYYTKSSINSTTFYLSNVPDFTVGNTVTSASGSGIKIDTSKFRGMDIIIWIKVEGKNDAITVFEETVLFDEAITVSEDYLEFDAAGGTDTFKITASGAYTITENLSWLSLSSTSGSSDKTITVTCSKNTSTSSRSGIITVKHTASGKVFEIEVDQDGAKKEPEVTDLSVSKTTVTVGEEFVITVKTNPDAYGVVLYVKDPNGEVFPIGTVTTASSTTSTAKTFKFNYYFNKTNNTNGSGADITNTRKLYAYPIGSDGNPILDDSVCDYVSMTVNPAEATFSEYEVKTPVEVVLGNSAVISWGKAISTIGATPTYKVYIDNEYYASTTSTSYTLPASYITELGVGSHGITIQATAPGHRAKQSSNHGALIIEVSASSARGDINGDGLITNKDRFWLNRYLKGMAGYTNIDKTIADINGDGSVNIADVEYLTRHLSGWVGYEKLPEITPEPTPDPGPAQCTHELCERAFLKTVWVSNTIKNGTHHQYYDEYNLICTECQKTVGKDKSKTDKKPHVYNSDGVCACGSIQTDGYVSWYAVNATGKDVKVYTSPYSTDGSYGLIYAGEQVKVIGSKAGRYLIEYTIGPRANGSRAIGEKKQGFVDANTLASQSDYRLKFTYETIELPVSGRKVLLIPMNHYIPFELYNGDQLLQGEELKSLKILFDNNYATIDAYNSQAMFKNGNQLVAGFGTLSAYYEQNGEKIYLQCPEYFVVADSIASSPMFDVDYFTQEEKDYIMMALDLHFSKNMIGVPYELYWSYGENFALCIEEFGNILASLLQGESPTKNDYAVILAEFLEKYVDAETMNQTVDKLDVKWSEMLKKILDVFQDITDVPPDLLEAVGYVNKIYRARKISAGELKILFERVSYIIKHNQFKYLLRDCPKLQQVIDDYILDSLYINDLAKKLDDITSNNFLFKKGGVFDIIGSVGDALEEVEHIVSFAFVTFGNWQRHRMLLEMMLEMAEKIPASERVNIENYDILVGAIKLLLEKYDEDFLDRLNENLSELAGQTIVWGSALFLAAACPGAFAIASLTQFFVGLGNSREEADLIRIRQFYLIMNQAILGNFESLYTDGTTYSSIYENANTLVKMFLNMAIYVNKMADDVKEYTQNDKKVYENNITKITKNFKIYLIEN